MGGKRNRITKNSGSITKGITCKGNTRRRRRKGSRRHFGSNNDWEFFKINDRPPNHRARKLREQQADKFWKFDTFGTSYSNHRTPETKGKSWKNPVMKNTWPTEDQGWKWHWTFCQKACQQEENGVKWLKCWKKQDHQPRILYAAKLCFKSERKILAKTNKNRENVWPVDLPCKKC